MRVTMSLVSFLLISPFSARLLCADLIVSLSDSLAIASYNSKTVLQSLLRLPLASSAHVGMLPWFSCMMSRYKFIALEFVVLYCKNLLRGARGVLEEGAKRVLEEDTKPEEDPAAAVAGWDGREGCEGGRRGCEPCGGGGGGGCCDGRGDCAGWRGEERGLLGGNGTEEGVVMVLLLNSSRIVSSLRSISLCSVAMPATLVPKSLTLLPTCCMMSITRSMSGCACLCVRCKLSRSNCVRIALPHSMSLLWGSVPTPMREYACRMTSRTYLMSKEAS